MSLGCISRGLSLLNSKTGDDDSCNNLSRYHASQCRQSSCRGVRAFHSFSPQVEAERVSRGYFCFHTVRPAETLDGESCSAGIVSPSHVRTWVSNHCMFLFIFFGGGGKYRVSSRSTTYMLQENTGCATIWNTRRMVPKNTSLLIGLSPYLYVRLNNRYCNFVLSRLLLSGFVVLSPPCHNTKVWHSWVLNFAPRLGE